MTSIAIISSFPHVSYASFILTVSLLMCTVAHMYSPGACLDPLGNHAGPPEQRLDLLDL